MPSSVSFVVNASLGVPKFLETRFSVLLELGRRSVCEARRRSLLSLLAIPYFALLSECSLHASWTMQILCRTRPSD